MVCPLINRCKKEVTLDHFLNTCVGSTPDAYKACPHYQEMATQRKPAKEWAKELLYTK